MQKNIGFIGWKARCAAIRINSFNAKVQGAHAVINDGISLMVRQWFAKP